MWAMKDDETKKEVGSPLRMRTRHQFGYGPVGSSYQHGYELAHMVLESDVVEEGDLVWTDDLMHKFFDLALPAIHLVEKLNLHLSDQFCYRLSWPSVPGIFLSRDIWVNVSFQVCVFTVTRCVLFDWRWNSIKLERQSLIY